MSTHPLRDDFGDRHEATAENYLLALDELSRHIKEQFGVTYRTPEDVLADVRRAAAHLALAQVRLAVHAGCDTGPVVALWVVTANPRDPHVLQAPTSYIPAARVRDGVLRLYATWRPGQKRAVGPYFLADWQASQRLDLAMAGGTVGSLPDSERHGRIVDARNRSFSLHRAEARRADLRVGDRVQFVATKDLTTSAGWRWAIDVRRVDQHRRLRLTP